MISLLLALSPAQAAGLLYTASTYEELAELEVAVEVEDRVATATARFTWEEVGALAHGFTAVLPADAAVIGLSYQDGEAEPVQATAHPAGEVQPVAGPDDDLDALLALDGTRTFHVALPALTGGPLEVVLTWQRVIAADDGVLEVAVPLFDGGLNPRAASASISWAVVSDVEVVGAEVVGTEDGSSIAWDAVWDAVWDATSVAAEWSGTLDQTQSVAARWQESAEALDLRVLSWRPEADPFTGDEEPDGYALLIVRPGSTDERVQQLFTFVLDISSSMKGQPLETAVDAGAAWLEALDPQDRFNLLPYASQPYPFRGRAPLAEAGAVERGLRFLDKQEAAGLSDPEEALRTAFELSADTVNQRGFFGCQGTRQAESPSPSREGAITATGDRRLRVAPYVVWLTDGGASTGLTDAEGISEALLAANTERASLFAIGLGDGVDRDLLQRVTAAHRGEAALVAGPEDVADAVSLLRERIAEPLLVRPELEIDAVDRLAPEVLGDLTRGRELVVAFRWAEDGEREVHLTGAQGQQDLDQTWTVSLPSGSASSGSAAVAMAWAQLRVAALDARYLAGETGLYSQIEELVVAYGVASDVVTLSFDDGEADAGAEAMADMAGEGRAGCGCSSRARSSAATPWLMLLGLWLGLAWRRRR